jgi:hypothetical protein
MGVARDGPEVEALGLLPVLPRGLRLKGVDTRAAKIGGS